MKQLVGIGLLKLVTELFPVLCVQQADVSLGQTPLLPRTELLLRREGERLESVVLCDVLVRPEIHRKAKLRLVRLSCRVPSLVDQMLELRAVAGVIEINHARSEVALSRLSSFQHLSEQGRFLGSVNRLTSCFLCTFL